MSRSVSMLHPSVACFCSKLGAMPTTGARIGFKYFNYSGDVTQLNVLIPRDVVP